ncbi:MAG: hypothetical protein ACXAC7_19050 [Candidatus Hodarchaeales archaeon]|jgi:hypothetical protein
MAEKAREDRKIDLKVRVRVSKVDLHEWDLVMNIWRACMLFFERELRKLADNGMLSRDTLHRIADKYDFSDLLRLSFRTLPDSERTRLVKLEEVSDAIQRVRDIPDLRSQQPELIDSVVEFPESSQQQAPDTYQPVKEPFPPESYPTSTQPSLFSGFQEESDFGRQPSFASSRGIQQDPFAAPPPAQPEIDFRIQQPVEQPMPAPEQPTIPSATDLQPNITVQDHLDQLQKNTASAVVELRRMMYNNLQKLKRELED